MDIAGKHLNLLALQSEDGAHGLEEAAEVESSGLQGLVVTSVDGRGKTR